MKATHFFYLSMKRNSRFVFPAYPIFSLSSSGERLTFQKTIGGHSKKARLEQFNLCFYALHA